MTNSRIAEHVKELTSKEQTTISRFIDHHYKTLNQENFIGRMHFENKEEVTILISKVLKAMAETIWE